MMEIEEGNVVASDLGLVDEYWGYLDWSEKVLQGYSWVELWRSPPSGDVEEGCSCTAQVN